MRGYLDADRELIECLDKRKPGIEALVRHALAALNDSRAMTLEIRSWAEAPPGSVGAELDGTDGALRLVDDLAGLTAASRGTPYAARTQQLVNRLGARPQVAVARQVGSTSGVADPAAMNGQLGSGEPFSGEVIAYLHTLVG